MKHTLTLISFFLFNLILQAQNFHLTIKDVLNNPVPFATVQNIQSKKVFVADADGELYYPLYKITDTLLVSSLGFIPQEVELQSDAVGVLVITLQANINELQAVQVSALQNYNFGFDNSTMAASSMVIDQKALTKLETNDINQVLYQIPGVQIQQEDGYGLRPNIGMRGTGLERSSKITLMEDGILIAPAPYAASSAYYFPSMDHVERIEVLKGSSQILYGPQTNGGAINLISTSIPDRFEFNAKASFGSFLTRKIQANVGDKMGNFSYLLQGSYFGSNGFKELPNNQNTGFNKGDVLVKIRFETDKNTKIYQSFNLKYAYTQENTNETYLGLSLDDFNQNPLQRYAASALDNIKSNHTQLQFTHVIKPHKNLSVSTSVYYNYFKRNWFKLDKLSADGTHSVGIADVLNNPNAFAMDYYLLHGYGAAGNRLYIKNNNRAYTSKGIQSNFYYNKDGEKLKHSLLAGFRLHADQMDRYQWTDDYTFVNYELILAQKGTPGTESNQIADARALSFYGQYTLSYKKISVQLGLRFEHMHFTQDNYGKNDTERTGANLVAIENKQVAFLPGLSVRYNYAKKNYLFAGVYKGFSPPNANPNTKPEESINVELGSKGVLKNVHYELVAFANKYKNLLGSDLAAAGGSGSLDLYNGGKVNVFGIESAISYNLLQKFSTELRLPIMASYTYTNATFRSNFESEGPWGIVSQGDFMPYLAKHQAGLQIGLEHKRFDINTIYRFVGKQHIYPSSGEFVNSDFIPFFYQIDLLGRYKINRYISVFSKINNLTNNVVRIAQQPAGWRPNMPFYIEGGVQIKL